jgi:hypothetical protein
MMRHFTSAGIAVLVSVLLAGAAVAQKGTGESTGMARRSTKPPIVTVAGTVTDIKIGPCKQTTGRSAEGVHLLLRAADNREINLHLGPSAALGDVIKAVSAGQPVTSDAFRTERMPQDAYVARVLTVGGRTFELRDVGLRPIWAGAGRGGGRGAGLGAGSPRGRGWGRNAGACFW